MNILGDTLGTLDENAFTLKLFWAIGLLGLTLIILQTVLGLVVGHDGDTDASGSVDLQGGHGGGGGYLSLKSISAMLLGFGFGGALLERSGFSSGISAVGGLVIGMIIGVAYIALMRSLYRLRSDGTSKISEAISRTGTVYLRVPGLLSGPGEIQVSFAGRLQNMRAFTNGPDLPTGTAIKVVALHGEQALLVEKLR